MEVYRGIQVLKRSKEYISFKKMLKFEKIGYSDLIPCLYVGNEVIHKYVQ